MEHKFYYNKKFYQDKKTGYWISTTCPKIRAHVWVWKYVNGSHEKGFHIHHKDGNKSNNDISNLESISVKEHVRKHGSIERTKANLIHVESIRPLTKEWHASEEGIKWHRNHGLKTWKERKLFKINCLMCGCEIETKVYHQKYCHQNCKAKHGRYLLKSKIN